MNKTKKIFLIILAVSHLTGCYHTSKSDIQGYMDKTREFVENLIKEDYNKCVELMSMEHELASGIDVEKLKEEFANLKENFVEHWGTQIEYTYMNAEKKFSKTISEKLPPNTTLVTIEFKNKREFGVVRVLFDDNSNKILNINFLDTKEQIPTMTYFWLFGVVVCIVPLFNIFVIRQIKRSALKRKWLKYIIVIFLNAPVISFAAVNGISIKLLSFQVFGAGLTERGFLNTYWAIGIPLGGLYWFWKIRQKKFAKRPAANCTI